MRARDAEPLQKLEELAAVARLALRRDRLLEGLLGPRVVALAHRPLAALHVQPGDELRRGADLLEGLAREPFQPLGAQEVAVARELSGVAQVRLEAVGHPGERYWRRSLPPARKRIA